MKRIFKSLKRALRNKYFQHIYLISKHQVSVKG